MEPKVGRDLTGRERRSLAVLAVVLSTLALYLWTVEPAWASWESGRAEVRAEREKLAAMAEHLATRDDATEIGDSLRERLAGVSADIAMPSPDVPLPQLLNSITGAAQEGPVQLVSMRPVRGLDNEEPRVEMIVAEGSGTADALARFLQRLGGLEVRELRLNRLDSSRPELDIAMRLSLLDVDDFAAVRALGLETPPAAALALAADPFTPRVPPRPPQRAEPRRREPAPEPPPAVLDLSGYELVGISQPGEDTVAIVTARERQEHYFVSVGDEIDGMKVDEIGVETVVLRLGKLSGTLRLPVR
jgi:hypothetical protein